MAQVRGQGEAQASNTLPLVQVGTAPVGTATVIVSVEHHKAPLISWHLATFTFYFYLILLTRAAGRGYTGVTKLYQSPRTEATLNTDCRADSRWVPVVVTGQWTSSTTHFKYSTIGTNWFTRLSCGSHCCEYISRQVMVNASHNYRKLISFH